MVPSSRAAFGVMGAFFLLTSLFDTFYAVRVWRSLGDVLWVLSLPWLKTFIAH